MVAAFALGAFEIEAGATASGAVSTKHILHVTGFSGCLYEEAQPGGVSPITLVPEPDDSATYPWKTEQFGATWTVNRRDDGLILPYGQNGARLLTQTEFIVWIDTRLTISSTEVLGPSPENVPGRFYGHFGVTKMFTWEVRFRNKINWQFETTTGITFSEDTGWSESPLKTFSITVGVDPISGELSTDPAEFEWAFEKQHKTQYFDVIAIRIAKQASDSWCNLAIFAGYVNCKSEAEADAVTYESPGVEPDGGVDSDWVTANNAYHADSYQAPL